MTDTAAPMIQIGASKEAIEARDAILAILEATGTDKTIRAALGAFVAVCEVKGGVTISDSTFTNNPRPPVVDAGGVSND